jgi:hypothetical protein
LESELPPVEDQHPPLAGRALRLYTHFLQAVANLVELILAEIGHRNSLASDHGALGVDDFVWEVKDAPNVAGGAGGRFDLAALEAPRMLTRKTEGREVEDYRG